MTVNNFFNADLSTAKPVHQVMIQGSYLTSKMLFSQLRIGNNTDPFQNQIIGTAEEYTGMRASNPSFTFNISPPIVARYVGLTLPIYEALGICEFAVY